MFNSWQKSQIQITIKIWLFLGLSTKLQPNSDTYFADCEKPCISALARSDTNYISFEERFGFGWGSLGLAVLTSRPLKYGKSLHIVAAIAVAVLTREGEISTCLQHIPALTLNITHLLFQADPPSPAAQSRTTLQESVFR